MNENHSGRKHNGWTNYETWAVKLWLDNEEPSYRYWTEQARRWHGREGAACRLAEQLKEELSDGSPANGPTVYGDLLNAALEEVHWLEIAESYLDEVDEASTKAGGRRGDVAEEAGPHRRADTKGAGNTRGLSETSVAGNPDRDGRATDERGPGKDTLPADVAKSLDELLWYVWQDEIESFIADEPGPDEGHIFRHIAVVDGWFYGHDATAEGLVAEFYADDDRTRARERMRSFRGE